ncbi:hypothetical protein ABZ568_12755 [Streptomyces olindensis]|uniref:Integral membrane protein n=1 Tax=Streptomyces olindensis TaxID=358823 RepID=A0ABV2XTD2_9ACTN|nr:hypothetical protein DF19_39510 [Streptomyces olindensis]
MDSGEPSTGQQIGVSLALVVIDFMLIAWMAFGVGIEAWADSYESDSASATGAASAASQAAWVLVGGAVLTGGGLLALGWRIPGVVQLVVLFGGAVLVSSLAAGG